MLGFPQELASERVSASGVGAVAPAMFGIKRLQFPPEDRPPTRNQQFVGQLNPGFQLTSVKGMSGGPIFGIRFKPVMAYWIVALKSSWNPKRRVVYGCDLPLLASLMTNWAKDEAAA